MRAYQILPVQEAMVWDSPALAAFIPKKGTIILYYETDELKTAIGDADDQKMEKDMVGTIKTTKRGKKNNISYSQVDTVWAEKGFGPLLYYAAMAKYGWLSPSEFKGNVSDSAKNVWKKFSQMSNIKSMDIVVHHDEDYLRKAYMLDNITKNKAEQALNRLLFKHRRFMGEYVNQTEITFVEKYIWKISDEITRDKMTDPY